MFDVVLIYKMVRNISATLKTLQHVFTCQLTVINIKLHTVSYLHANYITIQHSNGHVKLKTTRLKNAALHKTSTDPKNIK